MLYAAMCYWPGVTQADLGQVAGRADLAGALSQSITANGTITSLSLRGHVLVDVCAALS